MIKELLNTNTNIGDADPTETREWLVALASVLKHEGRERAEFLLQALLKRAAEAGLGGVTPGCTAYLNTLIAQPSPALPDDGLMLEKLLALLRWNATAIVLRAGKKAPGVGGHIASYASIATLYEVGFNYFFKAKSEDHPGDLLFIQGHSAPGIYARAFLEGRISEAQLENFRQEVDGQGLSSYPHPWLMPDFWQFPTVSMGLGALQAIYQARFLKYLGNRGLIDNKDRKVWVFCGDGEMDEPESVGALTLPAREQLDNLIFVINCNLQRLDGPVRGNGKVIQEFESLFRGAGWRVIKVLWGAKWDSLLAKDTTGLLAKRMQEYLDGDYQNSVVRGGAHFREHFFGKYPELLALVAEMSDDELNDLQRNRGGHDPQKVYAAYTAARQTTGRPTVILAKTIKGYGMGKSGEALNVAHQQKSMDADDLSHLCAQFNIPIPEKDIATVPFYRPDENSEEIQYLQKQRAALGGYLPCRHHHTAPLTVPDLTAFNHQLTGTADREISTTMAFVRILGTLLKDKNLKERIVPIVPDECRTFGMEGLFRQVGIYSPLGQQYAPEDKKQLMYYKESQTGQLLQEGINEAGAFSSWMAAATAYSNSQVAMIPFYIYYSMFGFQRIGDFAWAAADMRARGFLLGATAGRTTINGEGLQHQDGHSHVMSSLIPNCISYDPTYNYEVAVIIQEGLRRMYAEQEDIYYYLTLMNENYTHPPMPQGAETGIIKGMYRLKASTLKTPKLRVELLSCGTILRGAVAAAQLLEADYGIAADVWSVTSFTELRREALSIERDNRLHPDQKPKANYIAQCLKHPKAPVIAATDYVRLFADQIRAYVKQDYHVLGTDGFGRSDTRAQLRHFFEVDAAYIAYQAVYALVQSGQLPQAKAKDAMKRYQISAKKPDPVTV